MLTNLDIDVRTELGLPLDEDELVSLCDAVLSSEGVTRLCYLSLSVVSDDEIQATNFEWRGVDAPTDVISLECERPDDPDLAEDEPCELGDILLASAYVRRQAEAFGTTFADECRLLLVHGLLHLLGYDHMEEAEAAEMQAREEAVLVAVPTDGTLTDVVLTRHREEES